jgi:hypothetical protein
MVYMSSGWDANETQSFKIHSIYLAMPSKISSLTLRLHPRSGLKWPGFVITPEYLIAVETERTHSLQLRLSFSSFRSTSCINFSPPRKVHRPIFFKCSLELRLPLLEEGTHTFFLVPVGCQLQGLSSGKP